MSGQYRRSFRALGRCLTVCVALAVGVAAQSVSQGASAQKGPKQDKAAVVPDSQPTFPPAVQDAIERAARALEAANSDPNAAEERERSQDDLEAQREMARWARFMFWATFAQAFVGIVGIGFLYRNLVYARRAVQAAGEAATAANRSVEQSERHAQRELRAYLNFTIVETITIMDQLREDRPRMVHGYNFRVTVENAGATPAVECIVFSDHCMAEVGAEPTFQKPDDTRSRSAIGPHSKAYGPTIFVSREAAQRVVENQAKLYIWWRVEYRDVFENTPHRFVEKVWDWDTCQSGSPHAGRPTSRFLVRHIWPGTLELAWRLEPPKFIYRALRYPARH